MYQNYISMRRDYNPYNVYKKYKEGDYILTNFFTKRNSYIAKICKINEGYDEELDFTTGINSILVKIPKSSLKAGLYNDVKDEFRNFVKNNCYHREFCLCEQEEPDKYRCKKCNQLIYNNKELKRKNSINNKFYKEKSLSRPFPISFLYELDISGFIEPFMYSNIKMLLDKKQMKDISSSVNYFVKITPKELRYYHKKYVYLDKFCLFLFSQSQKKGFFLPYGLKRLIYSFF